MFSFVFGNTPMSFRKCFDRCAPTVCRATSFRTPELASSGQLQSPNTLRSLMTSQKRSKDLSNDSKVFLGRTAKYMALGGRNCHGLTLMVTIGGLGLGIWTSAAVVLLLIKRLKSTKKKSDSQSSTKIIDKESSTPKSEVSPQIPRERQKPKCQQL